MEYRHKSKAHNAADIGIPDSRVMRTTLPMGPTNKDMKSQPVAFTFYVDRSWEKNAETIKTR